LNSIEKALEILQTFTPDNQPLRSLEISNRLNMHKSTTNRILITLRKKGFVVQDETTRRYRLGPSTARLGRAVAKSLSGRLVALAKPYLDAFRDKIGETVNLEVVIDDRILLIYSAKGVRQVTVTPRVGDQTAIHANAGAKAIAAFSSQDFINKGLAGKLQKFTSKTVTDPAKIRMEYEKIRTTGLAYDKEERDEDVLAVAAPVFNHEDRVIAAVVMIAPAFRMSSCIESGSLELLKKTAGDISDRLSQL
jgi:DNA-binding IclR family transcriptional regulator